MVAPGQSQIAQSGGPFPPAGPVGDPIPWHDARELARQIALPLCGRRYHHLVDDIVQESLVRLFRNGSRITKGWRPFLSKITSNAARTALQREQRSRRILAPNQALVETTLDENHDPSEQVWLAECQQTFRSLLDRLDVEFGLGTRAIVELRIEGVPWKDIMNILRKPVRTCSSREARALNWIYRKLSLRIGKEGRDD